MSNKLNGGSFGNGLLGTWVHSGLVETITGHYVMTTLAPTLYLTACRVLVLVASDVDGKGGKGCSMALGVLLTLSGLK